MKQKAVNKILQETGIIYNQTAVGFSHTRPTWWRGFEMIKDYAKAGDQIIDLGCGNGRMANLFLDLDIKYLGVDNSSDLIDIASKNFENNNKIKFQVGNITDLKLSNKKFNIALMIAALHNVPGKELQLSALKNSYEILQDGGYLIISSWNLWQKKYWHYLFDYRRKIKYGIWSLKDAFMPGKSKDKPYYCSQKVLKLLL